MKRASLLLAILLALLALAPAQAEDPTKSYADYLLANSIPLASLPTEPLNLDPYQIYLIGESHGTAKAFTTELALIEHLARTQSATNLLLEIGYCDGQIINDYLHSGETAALLHTMEGLAGTMAYSQETLAYYEALRALSQALPTPLTVYGVDVQHQTLNGLYYLRSLLPDTAPPEHLAPLVDFLRQYENTPEYAVYDNLSVLSDTLPAYEAYLGDQYEQFAKAMQAIDQSFAYYEMRELDEQEGMLTREASIKENVEAVIGGAPEAKWTGVFGTQHVAMNAHDEGFRVSYLGAHLAHQYEVTRGKVAALMMYFMDSAYMNPQTGKAVAMEDGLGWMAPYVEALAADVVVCQLDRDGSPFFGDLSLNSQQYLVLVTGSEATVPYGAR